MSSAVDSSRDLSHRVARGAVSTFGATILGRAFGMAQSIAVARLLDPHRVGLFAIISYLTSLAGALCDLGIPVAVTKLTAEYRATEPRALLAVLRRLLQTVLGISLAVAAVIALGADRLAAFYREPSLEGLFRLAALSLVLSVLGGLRGALLQGFQQIHLLAALGAVNGGQFDESVVRPVASDFRKQKDRIVRGHDPPEPARPQEAAGGRPQR